VGLAIFAFLPKLTLLTAALTFAISGPIGKVVTLLRRRP
jgi:hypothetical protein